MAALVPVIASVVVSAAVSIALAWIVGPSNQTNFGERLRLADVQTSNYGIAITRLIGQARVAGNVIWQAPITETPVTTTASIRGGFLKPSSSVTNTTYTYFASFAVGICAGPITAITRIWADDVLIYDVNDVNSSLAAVGCVIYTGTEVQNPSPLIESIDGVDTHPAYRGLAYATFNEFPLQQYGNRVPRMSFEVEGL